MRAVITSYGFRLCGIAFSIVLGTVVANSCAQRSAPIAAVPDQIDYNWHVRPILSDNCFRCHGPDAKARKAGLRLDDPNVAYAELKESPGKYAIVPGNPERSELVRRITHPDPEERMPPQSLHKVLTTAQIETLREWIDQGAEYKPHWAYITPRKPRVPRTAYSDRVVNDIDRFIFARLEREELSPSAEADKETLINRVSLTLTGLPPTLDEVDAFVKDASPDAYERLVDRLTASPAYAEHMASYWMNLARWADTDGFLDDHHDRFLWPWRDWVIKAFGQNMPFDQFATWQLAGDLLPNRTKEQLLATAFLRLGKRTTENGAIDEEYRVEYVIDRTNTIGTAFLGLTVGCAQCHDHKYDAISQKDYYSLSGFFNSADEPGFYAPGQSGIQGGPTLPWPDQQAERKIGDAEAAIVRQEVAYQATRNNAASEASPKVDVLMKQSASEIADLIRASMAAATQAHYSFDGTSELDESRLPPPRPPSPAPRELVSLQPETRFTLPPFAQVPGNQRGPRGSGPPAGRPSSSPSSLAPSSALSLGLRGRAGRGRPSGPPAGGAAPPFPGRGAPSSIPNGYDRAAVMLSAGGVPGTPPAVIESPILSEGWKGKALFFNDTNKGFVPKDIGWYERTQPFSLDLWFYQGQEYKFHPNEMINQTGKGLPYGVPIVQHRDDDNSGGAGYRLQLEDGHLWVYLAHSRPANMIALKTVKPFPVKQWVHITLTYDGSSRAAGTKLYLNGTPAGVEIDHDTLTRSMLPMSYNAQLDRFPGFSFGTRFREKAPVGSGLDELRFFSRDLSPLEVSFLHDEKALASSSRPSKSMLTDFVVATDPRVVRAAAQLKAAREAHNKLVTLVPQVLVMGDAPKPRPPHRLDRGVYTNRAEEVPVRGLDRVFRWDTSLPPNRIGLAKWLFDPGHPLTARVFVNRMWQRHFGQGLVETSEDFGIQGAIPTHPELLDWLASDFVASDWDVKRLLRIIVTSATYRQKSDTTDELLEKDPRNLLLARGIRQRMSAEMVRDTALASSGLLVKRIGGPSVRPYQPDGVWNPLNSFWRYLEPDEVPADEHHRRTMYTFVKRNAVHPQLQIFDGSDPNISTPRRRTSNTPLQALGLMNDPQYVEAYRALATQALKQAADTDARLTRVFRLATRRRPSDDELTLMRQAYSEEEARFKSNPSKAAALLTTGVSAAESSLDQVQLAALTNVTALVMNSPDAYSIR